MKIPADEAFPAGPVSRPGRRGPQSRGHAGREARRGGRQGHVRKGDRRAHREDLGRKLQPSLHEGRRGRAQGQPGRPGADQHPAGTGRRRRRLARGQRHPPEEHRHLGPLRLHADRRRFHGGAFPRPDHRGAPDDGRGGGRGGRGRKNFGQQPVAEDRTARMSASRISTSRNSTGRTSTVRRTSPISTSTSSTANIPTSGNS